jgi:hypothetical protein
MTERNELADFFTVRAASLANAVNEHYFDLGEVLWRLKEENLYKLVDNKKYWAENHKLWKQFCEDKLSISYRTAQYWLQMYNYFNKMGVTKEELQGIGWSKAKELVDLTEDEELLGRCLEQARNGTLQELLSFIETFVERVGESHQETLKGRTFKFRLYEAAAEQVNHILELAGKSTTDQNEALFKVCIEWYQLTNPEKYEVEDIVIIEESQEVLF